MKGRKPTPTEVKELQGTLQPCRTNYWEPKVRQKISEETAPPEILSDEAKVHWNFVLEHEGAAWIKQCDRGMFEQYCELWAEITRSRKEKRALRAELSELRPQYEEALRFGSLDRAKVINARMEALEEKDRFLANLIVKSIQPFKSVAAELGLTPSSRSRVIALNGLEAPKKEEESELFSKEAMQKCLEFDLDYGGMN